MFSNPEYMAGSLLTAELYKRPMNGAQHHYHKHTYKVHFDVFFSVDVLSTTYLFNTILTPNLTLTPALKPSNLSVSIRAFIAKLKGTIQVKRDLH